MILIEFLRKVLLSIPSVLKKTLMSDRFIKIYSFSINSPLFKKAAEVLVFCISTGSNSIYSHVLSKSSKQSCNSVLDANLSE